ncbi:unnamed protein product [Prorocentrum cordatum]|uniref:Uncharacterized protein n=1 Tax=Prorocentrum cordatum TaxID=2364126 RepID=A0ABN9UDL9_9DINO|nr:unnamed protein product [Polarella glacialis]
MEREQRQFKDAVKKMEDVLAIAEAKLPGFTMQQSAEWDRPPEPTVFSCGSPGIFTADALKTAVAQWFSDARVPINCMRVVGSEAPNERFNIQIEGGAEVGAMGEPTSIIWSPHTIERYNTDYAKYRSQIANMCTTTSTDKNSPAGCGGAAVLAPNSAADAIAALPAEDWPQQWQNIAAPGRARVIHVNSPMSNKSMRIINAYNFDLTATTAAARHAAACWAAEDVENRSFIAIGDFQLNATQTASYFHPAPWQARRPAARHRQHPRQWKDTLDDQMVEVTSEPPTRCDKMTDTATCTVRASASLPPQSVEQLARDFEVHREAASCAEQCFQEVFSGAPPEGLPPSKINTTGDEDDRFLTRLYSELSDLSTLKWEQLTPEFRDELGWFCFAIAATAAALWPFTLGAIRNLALPAPQTKRSGRGSMASDPVLREQAQHLLVLGRVRARGSVAACPDLGLCIEVLEADLEKPRGRSGSRGSSRTRRGGHDGSRTLGGGDERAAEIEAERQEGGREAEAEPKGLGEGRASSRRAGCNYGCGSGDAACRAMGGDLAVAGTIRFIVQALQRPLAEPALTWEAGQPPSSMFAFRSDPPRHGTNVSTGDLARGPPCFADGGKASRARAWNAKWFSARCLVGIWDARPSAGRSTLARDGVLAHPPNRAARPKVGPAARLGTNPLVAASAPTTTSIHDLGKELKRAQQAATLEDDPSHDPLQMWGSSHLVRLAKPGLVSLVNYVRASYGPGINLHWVGFCSRPLLDKADNAAPAADGEDRLRHFLRHSREEGRVRAAGSLDLDARTREGACRQFRYAHQVQWASRQSDDSRTAWNDFSPAPPPVASPRPDSLAAAQADPAPLPPSAFPSPKRSKATELEATGIIRAPMRQNRLDQDIANIMPEFARMLHFMIDDEVSWDFLGIRRDAEPGKHGQRGMFHELPSLWATWTQQVAELSLQDANEWFSVQRPKALMDSIDVEAEPVRVSLFNSQVAEAWDKAERFYGDLLQDFFVQPDKSELHRRVAPRFEAKREAYHRRVEAWTMDKVQAAKDSLVALLNSREMPENPDTLEKRSQVEIEASTEKFALAMAEFSELGRPPRSPFLAVQMPRSAVGLSDALAKDLRHIKSLRELNNTKKIIQEFKVAVDAANKAIQQEIAANSNKLLGNAKLQELRSLADSCWRAFDGSLEPRQWMRGIVQYKAYKAKVQADQLERRIQKFIADNDARLKEHFDRAVQRCTDHYRQQKDMLAMPVDEETLDKSHKALGDKLRDVLNADAAGLSDTKHFAGAMRNLEQELEEGLMHARQKNIKRWKVDADDATRCALRENRAVMAKCGLFCLFNKMPMKHKLTSQRHLLNCLKRSSINMPIKLQHQVFENWYAQDLGAEVAGVSFNFKMGLGAIGLLVLCCVARWNNWGWGKPSPPPMGVWGCGPGGIPPGSGYYQQTFPQAGYYQQTFR